MHFVKETPNSEHKFIFIRRTYSAIVPSWKRYNLAGARGVTLKLKISNSRPPDLPPLTLGTLSYATPLVHVHKVYVSPLAYSNNFVIELQTSLFYKHIKGFLIYNWYKFFELYEVNYIN